ncbi:GHKL domain-containing protein [Enterococcus lactis]|uniref:GHKL domain-containing protein n=2 Tax=Enterococcus lactis TaxID=357441 RepID=UPI0034E9667B
MSNITVFHWWITKRVKFLWVYLSLFIILLMFKVPPIAIYLISSLEGIYYFYKYFHNLGRAWILTLLSIFLIWISLFLSMDISRYLHIGLTIYAQFIFELIIYCFFIGIFAYIDKKYQVILYLAPVKKIEYYLLTFYTIVAFLIACVQNYLIKMNSAYFYIKLQWILFLFIFLIYMFYNIYIEYQLNEVYTSNQLTTQKEEYYKELDGFRHDFKSLMFSLNVTIEEKDILATKTILDSMKNYSDPIIEYNQLVRIDSKMIRGLLDGLQSEAKEKGVCVKITIPDKIFFSRVNINTFDLVRLISIIVNNAIEESEKEKGEVSLFILNDPNEPEAHIKIICKNKVSEKNNINISKLLKKNYTTKNEHKGLGLSNFAKISKKYKNLVYKFTFDKVSQEFIVTIDIFY